MILTTETVADIIKNAESYKNMSVILLLFGTIGLALCLLFSAKSIMAHIRGQNTYLSLVLAAGLIFIVGLTGFYLMKQHTCEQYLILAHDYEYTCWYEGKEVDIDTMDIDRYSIEIDDAGKMLKLTKPVGRSHGYIPGVGAF